MFVKIHLVLYQYQFGGFLDLIIFKSALWFYYSSSSYTDIAKQVLDQELSSDQLVGNIRMCSSLDLLN